MLAHQGPQGEERVGCQRQNLLFATTAHSPAQREKKNSIPRRPGGLGARQTDKMAGGQCLTSHEFCEVVNRGDEPFPLSRLVGGRWILGSVGRHFGGHRGVHGGEARCLVLSFFSYLKRGIDAS